MRFLKNCGKNDTFVVTANVLTHFPTAASGSVTLRGLFGQYELGSLKLGSHILCLLIVNNFEGKNETIADQCFDLNSRGFDQVC